ncbi:MAG: DUF2723 domain-containing protein [Proteobacteria bacterium]|nr:DUF2723 domain-containing protein [Pseudomonadota bacterium]
MQSNSTPSLKILWWFTFIITALLYLATCQRGVSWQDSGMFQWRVLTGDYRGELGLALAHPLYIAAGRLLLLIPAGGFTTPLNFFSGLGMAVALANSAAVIFLLTRKRLIGFATAAMLAVTHTTWWLSTIAEVYTWSVAGLAGELWLTILLLRNPRWQTLAGLAFLNGLGLSMHNFALLPLPVYVAVAIVLISTKKLPPWSLAAAALSYLFGAGPYIGILAGAIIKKGGVAGVLQSALFGKFAAAVFSTSISSLYFKVNAAFAAINFCNMLLPLSIIGLINLKRRLGSAVAAVIWSITLIEFIFVVRYPVPDQFTFFLPTLLMLTVAAGVGISILVEASPRWRTVVIAACIFSIGAPPVFYASAPSLVQALKINTQRFRDLPFRDEVRYWLVPWKHNERSAEQFATAALKQASPDGVIIPDSTSLYPLLLVQRRDNCAPGVYIQLYGRPIPFYDNDPRQFRAAVGDRPLFVATTAPGYVSARLLQDAEFIRTNNEVLYRVRWKQ